MTLPYHKAPASLANVDHWLHVDCSACKRPISGCCTDTTCAEKGAMCGIRAIAKLTRSGSQGVVDDVALERACAAYDPMWDCRLMVEKQTIKERMRAALLAAMGGRGDGWIACSERMPPGQRYVLAWCPERRMAFQSTHEDGAWWCIGGGRIWEEVTHWMETPRMEQPPTTISEERP